MTNLVDLINNHHGLQKKYMNQPVDWAALPITQRQKYILISTRLLVEETVEVNRLLQNGVGMDNYKPFKDTKEVDFEELKGEVSDVFIHALGLAAHCGFSGEEMVEAINKKLNYNSTREDHTV